MRRGFTLVELVIVIAILGIIAGVGARYFDAGNAMFAHVDRRRVLVQEGRMSLLRIMREMRQLRSVNDVVFATADSVSFYAVDDSLYTFATSGGTLYMRRGTVSSTITGNVDSLAISYTREDGTPATPVVSPAATDIYRVGIHVRLRDGVDDVSLQAATFLRNL